MRKTINIHASALLIEGVGVLLRGTSGAGKSLLLLELIKRGEMLNRQAILIADDRVDLSVENDKIIISPPPKIAGLVELFGRGIIKKDYIKKARLDLIVDLVKEIERMPEKSEFSTIFEGVKLARCIVPERRLSDVSHQILLIEEAISRLKNK